MQYRQRRCGIRFAAHVRGFIMCQRRRAVDHSDRQRRGEAAHLNVMTGEVAEGNTGYCPDSFRDDQLAAVFLGEIL
jgi:hypothetical protein